MNNGGILARLVVINMLLLAAACADQAPEADSGHVGQASKPLQAMADEAAKTCGAGQVLEVAPSYFRCK